MSVEQVLSACGANSKTYRRLFREKTGMTPYEYRKNRK